MSGHTSIVEERCNVPFIINKQNSHEVYKATFALADYMSENIGIQRSDVLIVPCTDKILMELKEYALKASKEYISIEKRGDNIAVSKAAEDNLYIIGGMEYIGGLEFSAVIIIGADADKFQRKGIMMVNHYTLLTIHHSINFMLRLQGLNIRLFL